MKVYIEAMSMSRGDLKEWIEAHTQQTIIALAQLYLFPQGNRAHWRKEVWEKFHNMHKLKFNNKLPSSKFILNNSYELHQAKICRLLQYAIDKEEKYTPISSRRESEFLLIVQDYFIWLANQLSQTDLINTQEVLDELDSLGLTVDYERE